MSECECACRSHLHGAPPSRQLIELPQLVRWNDALSAESLQIPLPHFFLFLLLFPSVSSSTVHEFSLLPPPLSAPRCCAEAPVCRRLRMVDSNVEMLHAVHAALLLVLYDTRSTSTVCYGEGAVLAGVPRFVLFERLPLFLFSCFLYTGRAVRRCFIQQFVSQALEATHTSTVL